MPRRRAGRAGPSGPLWARAITGSYPLCPKFARGNWTLGLTGASRFSRQKTVFGVDGSTCLGAFGRGGFIVVLAISASSLGIAYLGFEHIASAVASYRNSV